MTRKKLVSNILDFGREVVFEYNGKECGIFFRIAAESRVWTFCICCDGEIKESDDLDILLADKFFDGKSIEDLLGEVEFEFC